MLPKDVLPQHGILAAPPETLVPVTPTNVGLSPSAPNLSLMPAELTQHLTELEKWAIANKSDATSDAIAFWSLKVPAILASACAGVVAHFDLTTISVIAGAIASVCVIIDGVHPRGMLRNIHLRAYYDIRILSSNMVALWRSRNSGANEDDTARQIIRDAEKERQRIAIYIRDAETALKFKSES